jgi:glycerophosphoryl diester phosphodiesterase
MQVSTVIGLATLAVFCAYSENAPRLLAHRGGAKEFDENSLGAFRASYEKGLRGFETDFRMTKDNALVILHDDTLDRTATAKGIVENMTAAEVKAIRLKKSGEPLPFAQDLMNYFKDKPDIFIELEMKTSNAKLYAPARLKVYCRLLHDAAKATMPSNTYCFTSFDKRALQTMKRLYPDAPVGLIVGGPLDAKQLKLAVDLKACQVAPLLDATCRKAIRDAKKAGLKVTGWMVNSEADYALGAALGCDNLTTDVPVRLLGTVDKKEVSRANVGH